MGGIKRILRLQPDTYGTRGYFPTNFTLTSDSSVVYINANTLDITGATTNDINTINQTISTYKYITLSNRFGSYGDNFRVEATNTQTNPKNANYILAAFDSDICPDKIVVLTSGNVAVQFKVFKRSVVLQLYGYDINPNDTNDIMSPAGDIQIIEFA